MCVRHYRTLLLVCSSAHLTRRSTLLAFSTSLSGYGVLVSCTKKFSIGIICVTSSSHSHNRCCTATAVMAGSRCLLYHYRIACLAVKRRCRWILSKNTAAATNIRHIHVTKSHRITKLIYFYFGARPWHSTTAHTQEYTPDLHNISKKDRLNLKTTINHDTVTLTARHEHNHRDVHAVNAANHNNHNKVGGIRNSVGHDAMKRDSTISA